MEPHRLSLSNFLAISLIVLLIFLSPVSTNSQTLRQNSLFSDYRAYRVGDVVTIHIIEFASGSNESSTSTAKESKVKAQSTGGTGALKFIPLFGMDVSDGTEFIGDGITSRKGILRAKMSAKITKVTENGNLVIEGSRIVEINNEKQETILSGVVRPEDITADNVVYSYNIADAKISYKGRGVVNTGQRPGWVTRIINWIF